MIIINGIRIVCNQIPIIFQANFLICDSTQLYHMITRLSYFFFNKIFIEKEFTLGLKKILP